MKTVLFTILGILFLFVVLQAFVMNSTSNTEMHQYQVLKRYDAFEIRKYEKANFSYVTMDSKSYRGGSGYGFRKLAGYIFGANEENQKIAMTSPVSMDFADSTTMMFMIPSEYELEDLPEPNDKDIKFKTIPSKIMAAIQFDGWANDKRIQEHKDKLIKALNKEGINHKGNFSFLGYNPPYEVVDRRNEVVVEVVLN